jgi:ABC-type nitrate/sulfonate/bicarbonate transport system substrate-binding protein
LRLPSAILWALCANVALLAAVLFYDKAHKRNRTIDHVVLYLQWSNQAQFAGFYVAKDMNFYDNENLEVTKCCYRSRTSARIGKSQIQSDS